MSPPDPTPRRRAGRRPRGAPGADELAFATVSELQGLLGTGRVSSEELTRLALERLQRLGPRYNAVATVTAGRALAEAQARDRARARGAARGDLHGIPYGAKDLLAARGAPTTWGAPPYRDQVFDADATVVQRLGRAGAVLAAKLAMVELAGGGGYRYPSASLQGPGKTPWSPRHWAGGSSSGSGAAVAAGLVPYAIGSETSGSIITPAAFCGVTGLRPTYGLVSRHGAMPLSWTLDKLGPMARSADCCARVLQAIAGRDRSDPSSARRSFRYQPLPPPALRRLRLGFAPADFDHLAAPEARPAFSAALDVLWELGAPRAEVGIPPGLPYGPLVGTIIGAEEGAVFGPLIESDAFQTLVDAKQKAGLRAALGISARDYLDAMRLRVEVQRAFGDLFRGVDVLIGVGLPGPAPLLDEPLDRGPAPGPAAEPDDRPANPALIPAGNLAGLPALSLPCGFTPPGAPDGAPSGLPLAIQLVGPPFSENTLLSLGAWFQSRTDWHRRRPPP
ncbi:MAG TPA: amidase [Chloroflexota bacterium]|nr:amidase [Chloroflexota bacterium]